MKSKRFYYEKLKYILISLYYYIILTSAADCNGTCDVCKKGSDFKIVNFTSEAKRVCDAVNACMGQRTLKQVVTMLRGGKLKPLQKAGLDQHPLFGSLKHMDTRQLESIVHKLV